MGALSDDPRSWGIISKERTPRSCKARLRDQGGIWIATYYIAFADSTYRYLLEPRFVQIRIRGSDVAIMPCAGDEEGAIAVQGPYGCRNFVHIILPRMTLRSRFRTGRYLDSTQYRCIGTEPYIAVDGVWFGHHPARSD